MTVAEFFDMVMTNEYHKICIKSAKTDSILDYFESVDGFEKSKYGFRKIVDFATDWKERVYILWV